MVTQIILRCNKPLTKGDLEIVYFPSEIVDELSQRGAHV